MGGSRRHRRRSRIAALAAAAVLAAPLLLAACGGDSGSGSVEATGAYPVQVTTASFPARQRLGETSLLRVGVRNSGERAVPALTMTFSIAGEEGRGSSLPFGIRSPEPGLAQPDRPVWVLAEHYPRLAGSEEPAGAERAARKSFDFGRLAPGRTVEAVWKLSAVRTGRHRLLYEIAAGPDGEGRAVTAGGAEPGGSFAVRIAEAPPETIVTDSGEVVEAPRAEQQVQTNR